MNQKRPRTRLAAVLAIPIGIGLCTAAWAAPALSDYKYFRSLSIDLLGRMPTRQEVAEFEKPGFRLDPWLDAHLQSDAYAERLTRVYADLLRPQINSLRYNQTRMALAAVTFKAPGGNLTRLYYRPGQVRARTLELRAQLGADMNYKRCAAIRDPAKDPNYQTWACAQYEKYDNLLKAGMCLQADELGVRYDGGIFAPQPFPALAGDKPGDPPRAAAVQAALDQRTTSMRPWWLYADYRNAGPADRYDPMTWAARFPGFVLNTPLLKEPDNKTDTLDIRVCKEETAAAAMAPMDSDKTKMVSCLSGYGAAQSSGCGCGTGLELCLPAATHSTTFPAAAFISSRNVLLGVDDPEDQTGFSFFDWHSLWMSQELQVFLTHLFAEDRDVREMVTGRHTYVNGPLSQFYRFAARSYWNDPDPGQTPLPDPASLPANLLPQDTGTWILVPDRGPNAAGMMTMPWFLMKNATRRARGHITYNAFLCRDFVAPQGLRLPPSAEPNLTRRDGCAACHQTLEPLAAYFSRLVESDWSWLDPQLYPAMNPACKQTMSGKIPGSCTSRYDNVFSTSQFGMLRGAYAAPDHADLGPAGVGAYLAAKPEFAGCVAQNIAASFLGRAVTAEDADLLDQLVNALTTGGFKARAMVKVLLDSSAYRSANNLSSTVWRKEGK